MVEDFFEFLAEIRKWGLEQFGRYYGPYRAQVLSNKDPLGAGRVKVSCPRARLKESNWIYPMAVGNGPNTGQFWPAEPGDIVFIFFDNGDPTVPLCYTGAWYAP